MLFYALRLTRTHIFEGTAHTEKTTDTIEHRPLTETPLCLYGFCVALQSRALRTVRNVLRSANSSATPTQTAVIDRRLSLPSAPIPVSEMTPLAGEQDLTHSS